MSPERPGLPSPLHAAVKTAVQVPLVAPRVALPPVLVIPPSPPFPFLALCNAESVDCTVLTCVPHYVISFLPLHLIPLPPSGDTTSIFNPPFICLCSLLILSYFCSCDRLWCVGRGKWAPITSRSTIYGIPGHLPHTSPQPQPPLPPSPLTPALLVLGRAPHLPSSRPSSPLPSTHPSLSRLPLLSPLTTSHLLPSFKEISLPVHPLRWGDCSMRPCPPPTLTHTRHRKRSTHRSTDSQVRSHTPSLPCLLLLWFMPSIALLYSVLTLSTLFLLRIKFHQFRLCNPYLSKLCSEVLY
jgi:hypothetical protein